MRKALKTEKAIFPAFRIPLPIDLEKLLKTRALIQAGSGGGKSYLVRKLNETFFGHVQQIILDPEGEYGSLREKFEYVLVGKGGDIPISVRFAGTIALRLLKMGLSAIIDLSEFNGDQKKEFVHYFITGLLGAPDELWHSLIVYLDEAQKFCPEDRQAMSTKAVEDMMTLGRKRGVCGVLACQRISQLRKNAAAECNNKFIGRTGMDIDRTRAGSELGYSKKSDVSALRTLSEGEFLCFGPAISQDTQKFKVGPVITTHYSSGAGIRTSPPTPAAIKKILKDLEDIPQEAEKELRSKKDYLDEIARLQAANKKIEKEGGGVKLEEANRKIIEYQSIIKEKDITIRHWSTKAAACQKILVYFQEKVKKAFLEPLVGLTSFFNQYSSESIEKAVEILKGPTSATNLVPTISDRKIDIPVRVVPPSLAKVAPSVSNVRRADPDASEGNGKEIKMGKGHRGLLAALAMYEGTAIRKNRACFISGLSPKGGHTGNVIGECRRAGWLQSSGDMLEITPAGLQDLGDFTRPADDPDSLIEFWAARVGKGAATMLKVLQRQYPDYISRDQLGEQAGLVTASGHFGNCLGELRTLGVLEEQKKEVRLSKTLYE